MSSWLRYLPLRYRMPCSIVLEDEDFKMYNRGKTTQLDFHIPDILSGCSIQIFEYTAQARCEKRDPRLTHKRTHGTLGAIHCHAILCRSTRNIWVSNSVC